MWQYMAILELGGLGTFMYDAYIESPEVIVDDYYYDDDDDLHDEWKLEALFDCIMLRTRCVHALYALCTC